MVDGVHSTVVLVAVCFALSGLALVRCVRGPFFCPQRHILAGGTPVTGVWDPSSIDRIRVGYVSRLSVTVRVAQTEEASGGASAPTAAVGAAAPMHVDHHGPLSILEAALLPVLELMGTSLLEPSLRTVYCCIFFLPRIMHVSCLCPPARACFPDQIRHLPRPPCRLDIGSLLLCVCCFVSTVF